MMRGLGLGLTRLSRCLGRPLCRGGGGRSLLFRSGGLRRGGRGLAFWEFFSSEGGWYLCLCWSCDERVVIVIVRTNLERQEALAILISCQSLGLPELETLTRSFGSSPRARRSGTFRARLFSHCADVRVFSMPEVCHDLGYGMTTSVNSTIRQTGWSQESVLPSSLRRKSVT